MEFLERTLRKTLNRLIDSHNSDSGAVFFMVLLVSMLLFVMVLSIVLWTMSSVMTVEMTTSRANAYDAAEGARNAGIADVMSGYCPSPEENSVSGIDGTYSVYHLITTDSAQEIPDDVRSPEGTLRDGFVPGCANNSQSDLNDIADSNQNVYTYVEGIGRSNDYIRRVVSAHQTEGTEMFKEAIVTHGDIELNGQNGTENTEKDGNIVLADGNFSCDGDSEVDNSVYVLSSNSTSDLSGCADINGEFMTAGDVDLSGASGYGDGHIFNGDVCIEGELLGMEASELEEATAGNVRVGGEDVSCGVLDQVGEAAWVDYAPGSLDNSAGSPERMWDIGEDYSHYCPSPESDIDYDTNQLLKELLEEDLGSQINYTYDFRGCDDPFFLDGFGDDIGLGTGSRTFLLDDLEGINNLNLFDSSGSSSAEFNVVIPDNNNSNVSGSPAPHCENSSGDTPEISINHEGNDVSSLIYSPCPVDINSDSSDNADSEFRGQIYTGGGTFYGHSGSSFVSTDAGTRLIENDHPSVSSFEGNYISISDPNPIKYFDRQ